MNMVFDFPENPTIKDIHDLYLTSQATVAQVVEYFLEKVKQKDGAIQAVVRYNEDLAKSQAGELDTELEGKTEVEVDELLQQKPLFGVPYAMKDNVLVEGETLTAQSKILDGYEAAYSADIFGYLKEAGAVLVAQTNMDEFAFGSSTEFSGFGLVTKNPWDNNRVAGGTSGGSAALVASGSVPFAIGTDTGGSIRQPSSFCGVVGIRPTYGSVPRYGIVASTSSFDQAGPISNSIVDSETVLKVLQQRSANDQTSIDITLNNPKPDIVVGFPEEFFGEGLDEGVKEVFEGLKEKLGKTYQVKSVSLPMSKYNLSVYYILQTVEAAANLERFDSVRYGQQNQGSEMFFGGRGEYMGDETKRRIMLGTYTSSSGYYDAYYNKACQVRELISRDFAKVFESVDVLVMPASPYPAFQIGENSSDPMSMYLADIMTVSQPISKLPALVVPGGFVDSDGGQLPVGIQLVGAQDSEETLYELGKEIMK